jgi:mannose-6-phosphate isomerase-like protein (cupin superfamily)
MAQSTRSSAFMVAGNARDVPSSERRALHEPAPTRVAVFWVTDGVRLALRVETDALVPRIGSTTGDAMPRAQLRFGKGFRVALRNARAQAATMVLPPGDSEGGRDNDHRGADQWLFVISGKGQAIIAGRRHALRAGTLLLVERGAKHEIRNVGRTPLKTLNVYVPPAYRKDGEPLPRGRP